MPYACTSGCKDSPVFFCTHRVLLEMNAAGDVLSKEDHGEDTPVFCGLCRNEAAWVPEP